jgi:hypothetical protein
VADNPPGVVAAGFSAKADSGLIDSKIMYINSKIIYLHSKSTCF